MTNDYITVKSLQVDYLQASPAVRALDAVDLTLVQGQIGVIIGPSGCGKSTLLHVLAGLNNQYSGQVLIDGQPPQCGSHSALILQQYGLLPWKTVRDNVLLGLQLQKKSTQGVAAVLQALGILSLADRYPAQLSGGQRQRVAIARALVLEPKLLLMDEPFSSLDALTREEIQDLLLSLWRQEQLTIVLITHSIEEAVFLGHKIFVLSPGPGQVLQVVDNPLAGDSQLRGKVPFLATCNQLRSLLTGRGKNAGV